MSRDASLVLCSSLLYRNKGCKSVRDSARKSEILDVNLLRANRRLGSPSLINVEVLLMAASLARARALKKVTPPLTVPHSVLAVNSLR